MKKRAYETKDGTIVYWVSKTVIPNAPWLIFLSGLTADHRLFEKQIAYFEDKANVLAWDPPSHGESRPFALNWTLDDLARLLHGILDQKDIAHPILIGQSMGGYTAQAFMDIYPGEVAGFVSIDSCPLKREYYSDWELTALRHTKLMFRMFPWKTLVRLGASNNSRTDYGRNIMQEMMLLFEKSEYCDLSAHGFRTLADAVAANRSYEIDCAFLLICGTEDHAGSAQRYNREWEKRSGNPVNWIEGAGHNSNCDEPDIVNALIEQFIDTVASIHEVNA